MDSRIIFVLFIALSILIGIISTVLRMLPYWRVPRRIRRHLDQVDGNFGEILKVLRRYQREGDQERLGALYYLLEHMHLHYRVELCLRDCCGREINYNAARYKDFEEARSALGRLEKQYGQLDWHVKQVENDQHKMSAELLIENIEYSMEVWKTLSWSKGYDYKTFINYILPYRGSNEQLESFRPYFYERYKRKLKPVSLVEVATQINEDLKQGFRFNSKYYLHPTDQGLSEMLNGGEGRCEDMTNLAVYAMRANGIAVVSDYTPHWADSGNNHAWNAILKPNGETVPFMGCESNPGEYKLRERIGKVYRKMYSAQESSLGNHLRENEIAPSWLKGKNYLDVTSDYVKTADVRVEIEGDSLRGERFMYLAVFNSGNWEAISWSQIIERIAEFPDMGVDLVYLPVYYIEGKLEVAGEAFLLNSSGEKEELVISREYESMDVRSTTRLCIQESAEGSEISNLAAGKEYELYYWHRGWQNVSRKRFESGSLHFEHIPSQGLYWLKSTESVGEERIFIYKDERQIWY